MAANKEPTTVVSNLVDVVNISSQRATFELDGNVYELGTKETVKIHRSYANPREFQKGRDPTASVIELLTNKRVLPLNDHRAREALGLPNLPVKTG